MSNASKRYPPYPNYEPSGIEWIGNIPSGWNVVLLKRVTQLAYGDSLPSSDEERQGNFRVFGSNGAYSFFSTPNTKAPVIVVGRKGSYGKINWSDEDVFASDTTFFIDSSTTNHELRWLYYVLQLLRLDEGSNEAAVPGLNREVAYNRQIPLPTSLEQRAIADFLDRETAKIDELIEKKQHLLDLLAEKRQTLITHSVTKGLDPNIQTKDSEVEWIGEIPETWDVVRVKYVTTKIGSGKTPRGGAEVYTDEGIIFIRSQNVHFDGLRLEDVVFIDPAVDSEMATTRVKPNDVLLNITGASLGRCAYVPTNFPNANVNQHVCIIRPNIRKVSPRFLHAIISSDIVQRQIFISENGVSREGLTFGQISDFWLSIPSTIEEQKQIMSYLDTQINRITLLQKKVEIAIERLQERRVALISEVVIGKIDVRGNYAN